MSGFTKGPWEWWTSNSLKRLSAGGKDGAVLHAYRCPDGASDIQVSDADARLIASSPELYEALEALLPYAQHTDSCGDMDAYNNAVVQSCGCGLDSTIEHVRAALSKAAGEVV